MNDIPLRQAAILGLFILLALVIFVAALLGAGNLGRLLSREVEVQALFDEVHGLSRGDSVWFAGVRVGVVETLELAPGGGVRVHLGLQQDAATNIPSDVEARVGSDGLIGNPIVELSDGTAAAPPVEEGDVLATGQAVTAEELFDALARTNEQLLDVTGDVKAITEQVARGEGTLGRLIADDTLYVEATTVLGRLDRAARSAESATETAEVTMDRLAAFSADLNQEDTLVHGLVRDQEAYRSLQASLEAVEEASTGAAALVADTRDARSPLGVLLADEAAGADLAVSLQNLSEGSVLLNENLRALRENFLFRRYFRRQEREERRAE